jgi:hypothetical protein
MIPSLEASQQETAHCHVDEHFARLHLSFVIFIQASAARKPGERAFSS